MSSPLFHVTIPPSSLPGHQLYPKLAMVKLEDPQLQPMVEKKGCEKMLASMRDCLVDSHTWDKCNGEFQKFHECINTKYFEDKDTEEIEEEVIEQKDVVNREYETKDMEADPVSIDKDVGISEELIEPDESQNVTDKYESEDGNMEDNNEDKIVDEEDKSGNNDSFHIKVINKGVEDEHDEDLLFNVSVINLKSKPIDETETKTQEIKSDEK